MLRNTLVVYSIFRNEVQEIKSAAEKSDAEKKDSDDMEVVTAIEQELSEFYEDDRMAQNLELVNEVLAILTRTQLTEYTREVVENIVCIFEAHLPELEQVFKQLKAKEAEPNEESKEVG